MTQQETLEEAADKYTPLRIEQKAFIAGAKFQAEKMYSEEEVLNIINQVERFINKDKSTFTEIPNWFIEQFKKK